MPKTRDSQTLATALRDLASAQESIGERIRLRFQQAEEVGDNGPTADPAGRGEPTPRRGRDAASDGGRHR